MDQDRDIIRRLVRDMIESDRTAEEVCAFDPSLVPEVRRLWRQARAVEEQIGALFPTSDLASRTTGITDPSAPLPRIPGYDIQCLLGFGGMGVVYKAKHLSLNRTVAIKMPLAGARVTAAERQRHVREARAVAALTHPNIITVYEVGEFSGQPYFTMEFIDGQNLGAMLANTPQPAREAASLVATLANAVEHAHADGVIHRDLKPGNILLAPGGTVKITDFGLARHQTANATLTVSGLEFGTPSYMSPEQADGRAEGQGPSVDIYSLGAILYEMLTGRPPFRAENAVETLRQVLEEDPAPPSHLNPKVPRDLETICLMCLRKDPGRRYQTAAAVAEDLGRFLRGEPVHARPFSRAERLYRWGRRRPAYAALIAAAGCGLVVSIGIGFWLQDIQNARAAEARVRESRAAQAIETALNLTSELRANGRWVEARHVLEDAYTRVGEANSEPLADSLHLADRVLTAAWELDDIRRRYPETSDIGFDYRPAGAAYRRVFDGLGLGSDLPPESDARTVNESPIRKEILIALDNAAFVALVNRDRRDLERWLTIARTADPDPWRDRFRRPDAWGDRATLEALSDDARSAEVHPPPHQIVIIGVLLSGFGADAEATEILHNAHRLNPVDFWVNLELGNALLKRGKTAEASQYYRTAVSIRPENPGPWVSLGAALNRSGSRDEATIAVRHAIDLNPRLIIAWLNYISYLRAAGRIDDAETAVTHAAAANPDQRSTFENLRISLRWDRARLLAARGEWVRALDDYRSLLPSGPNDAEFLFEVAAVSLIAGDHQSYATVRDAMLQPVASGTLRPALVARAVTLTPGQVDSVKAATALSETELDSQPRAFWSLTQRGANLCRAGRHAEAIPLFEQSIVSDPLAGRVVLNRLWLAIANLDLGNTEEAARHHAVAVAWIDSLDHTMPDNAAAIGLHIHNWLEAQILRRELDSLLSSGGHKPS